MHSADPSDNPCKTCGFCNTSITQAHRKPPVYIRLQAKVFSLLLSLGLTSRYTITWCYLTWAWETGSKIKLIEIGFIFTFSWGIIITTVTPDTSNLTISWTHSACYLQNLCLSRFKTCYWWNMHFQYRIYGRNHFLIMGGIHTFLKFIFTPMALVLVIFTFFFWILSKSCY